jgi:pyridoxine kinase
MTSPIPSHPRPGAAQTRPVLLISSLVARGRVGLRAQSFALERMGFEPWLVPTITLPFHPGHGIATTITPSVEDFSNLLDDLLGQPEIEQIAGVITGYLPGPQFAEPVANTIRRIQAASDTVLVTVDPVIGDEAGLYVTEETAGAIRDALMPLANMVTPNRFELEWLTGMKIEDGTMAVAAARTLDAPMTLITSAHPMMRNSAANLLVEAQSITLAETPAIAAVPHGPGDLTAAVMTANLLNNFSATKALDRTTGAVHEVLAASAKFGTDELALIEAQPFLERPRTPVALRTLGGHGGSRARGRLTPSPLT